MFDFNTDIAEWTWAVQVLSRRNFQVRLDSNTAYVRRKTQSYMFSSARELVEWVGQNFKERNKIVRVGDRWYGLKILNFVIQQDDKGMRIVSRHKSFEAAVKHAKKISVSAPIAIIGNPKNKYKVGDYVDPEDISWQKSPDACSMCLNPFHGCMPNSLNFKCPLLAGNIICETIQMHCRM